MILAALLLAQAGTAIEAEREFNRVAQTQGQWTAFRRYATGNAVMFVPGPVNAQAFLKDRKDPPVAVQWWPAESYVSCDGTVAVNTGPWASPRGSGFFTTVWLRQEDGGWKWIYDGGDALTTPRALPEQPRVRHAACSDVPPLGPAMPGPDNGASASRDGSLRWKWSAGTDGSRSFTASIWTGERFEDVVADHVPAPQ
ncbi:hypothetical protein [Sphingomonas sp.]|uniref:hypothetical protein n=1 Tax=Sphingomonas sp. TaxID=28214 RepID=UPI002ED8EC33